MSLYSINRFAFKPEAARVYSAVRTEFLNIIQVVCLFNPSITPTRYIRYVSYCQLISAPKLSHEQTTNKNYKMEASIL
jgi:hypothetical protein